MTLPSSPSNKKSGDALRPRTRMVRGALARSGFDETSEALFLNSGYVYSSAEEAADSFSGGRERFVYSRFSNPTVATFEKRLALIEGAEACRATASGMAAVFASIMCLVKAGDHVVSSRAVFGSCQYIVAELLPRYGVNVQFVDGPDLDQWKKALAQPTACVFLETPANPTLELIDISAVAELAHKAGAKLIVDNVFATPLLQSPLQLGADIVVYSATKHIDGQGRCLGGAILGNADYVTDALGNFLRHTGPALSPFNAWVLTKGLETLALRVEAHCAAAQEIAAFLSGKKGLKRVLYPGLADHPQHDLAKRQMRGFGSVVSIECLGGREGAFRFLNALEVIDISNNLGDAKSLITHPATTTHQRLPEAEKLHIGVTEGLLRLSVGLEDPEDLLEDLARGLAALG